jgi:hypothetical protein
MKTRFTAYHNPEVWQEPRYADTASGKWYRASSQECLKTPPIAAQIITIRSRSSVFRRNSSVRKGEEMWIAAVVRDQILLIERPIIAGGRAGLGRSPENVRKPAALGASRSCLPVPSACK